jgi:hypothetical protein
LSLPAIAVPIPAQSKTASIAAMPLHNLAYRPIGLVRHSSESGRNTGFFETGLDECLGFIAEKWIIF